MYADFLWYGFENLYHKSMVFMVFFWYIPDLWIPHQLWKSLSPKVKSVLREAFSQEEQIEKSTNSIINFMIRAQRKFNGDVEEILEQTYFSDEINQLSESFKSYFIGESMDCEELARIIQFYTRADKYRM